MGRRRLDAMVHTVDSIPVKAGALVPGGRPEALTGFRSPVREDPLKAEPGCWRELTGFLEAR